MGGNWALGYFSEVFIGWSGVRVKGRVPGEGFVIREPACRPDVISYLVYMS